ncbi:hypothetical protein [Flammeovirga sp. EKP202]|uniref:hypothetical protein n=1 Tax=Flammeovirga sp. EKP202 TaxID=2770592 RepID=UPI00165FC7E1|nr:hypothetical protein [Flammeovirga sp. EKP202]MBD0404116.1 hypothetical protein [Flammeovirga sp. EKP202]
MNLSKKIYGYLLFAIYSMVLLHNVVPHIHIDSDVDHVALFADTDHHHHSHDHSHSHDLDHEESDDIGFFHTLGHMLEEGYHTYEVNDHLTNSPTEDKVSLPKLNVYYSVIPSFVLHLANEILEKEPTPFYFPPPYEQRLFSATPLRGPPSIV